MMVTATVHVKNAHQTVNGISNVDEAIGINIPTHKVGQGRVLIGPHVAAFSRGAWISVKVETGSAIARPRIDTR